MTPGLVWPLGLWLRLESKPTFGGGQERARLGQRKELGPSLSCPPRPRSRNSPSLPHFVPIPTSPPYFLLPSSPIDVHTRRHRRKKPTGQRHQGEIYYKNCTKEPVRGPGLGQFLPAVNGCGSAGGDGAQAGGGFTSWRQSGEEHPVQQMLRLLGPCQSRAQGGQGSGQGAGQGGSCPPVG